MIAVSSVMSVGAVATASPTGDSTTVPGDSTPGPTRTPETSTSTTESSTTVDPFGIPAYGEPLQPGARPGSTVQTRTPAAPADHDHHDPAPSPADGAVVGAPHQLGVRSASRLLEVPAAGVGRRQ